MSDMNFLIGAGDIVFVRHSENFLTREVQQKSNLGSFQSLIGYWTNLGHFEILSTLAKVLDLGHI